MRAAALLFFLCALLAAADDHSFVLRGVTVHPVTSPDIENASVLVRDGKIAEVSQKVAAKGVREIQAKGLHAYPGMINSATTVGLSEIGSIRETSDTNELGDYNPQLRAAVAVNPASEHIPVTRASGITTVITGPDGGIIPGQCSIVHLDGWTWEEMEVRRSAGLRLNFPVPRIAPPPGPRTQPPTPYPQAKKDYDAKLRAMQDFFEQARRYRQAKGQGSPDFKTDLKYEAMLPVLEGKLPVVLQASRQLAIKDALAFAEKEKIRVVLAGVEEIGNMTEELKKGNIPVIAGKTFRLPSYDDDAYDDPYTLPARLHTAGVKFAFGTFDTEFARNLPFEAANAVAFGLPYAEALKAVTINAAEIWGVASEIGSIEKGKWADLIVTDGDPLEARTQVKQMYIKGKPVDLETKHTRLYQKYLHRP
jgi:imidazolonepropionase-like amidohydrolase